jgi:hypothetical protein
MIVEAIVAELNLKHGADLASEIDFSRGGDTAQSSSTADPAIVVVGNSHASYLATALAALGYKSSVIEMRPWRPNTITVNETKLELESKLACTPNFVAIIHILVSDILFFPFFLVVLVPNVFTNIFKISCNAI